MDREKLQGIFISGFTIALILGISLGIIAYGRGYRFDIGKRTVGTTGLLAATSDPVGATLFIDGKKRTATNTNVTIPPGWYNVTIVKDGYQSWEKRVRVQGEVVARADAMLFSSNPSLFTLTSNGALNPSLSPDGTKLAFIVPEPLESTMTGQIANKAGVWVLDLIDKPLGMNRDARIILKREQLNVDNAILSWSPDSKQIHIEMEKNMHYLIDSDKTNDFPKPVPDVSLLLSDWSDQEKIKEKEKLMTLKDDLLSVATTSMKIIAFSPDESKILYEATASATIPPIITPPLIGTNPTEEMRTITVNNLYVYDIKEDKNYPVKESLIKRISQGKTENSGTITSIQWLPTSRHLMLTAKNNVAVMDSDGTNKKIVYAGPFWDGFVAPWGNAGRIVILTTLNPSSSGVMNLYAVNIR